ncbi:MAG: YHS domain-containing protein [Planctomycetes bacterium]|nr:YHS domain-containing protein [Planctomycetota bacterium]
MRAQRVLALWGFTLAGLCLLAASATLHAEEKADQKNPGKKLRVKNADDYEDAGLCPVCHAEHSAKIHAQVGGRTYHFDSGECKREFKENPEPYLNPAPVDPKDLKDLGKIPTQVPRDIPRDVPKNLPKPPPKGPSK